MLQEDIFRHFLGHFCPTPSQNEEVQGSHPIIAYLSYYFLQAERENSIFSRKLFFDL